MIKARCRTFRSEIHVLVNCVWSKEELPDEWKQPITVPICKKADKTDGTSIEAYDFYQLLTKFYPTFYCQGSLHKQRKLLGIIRVDSDATGELLIVYSALDKYWRKDGNTVEQCTVR